MSKTRDAVFSQARDQAVLSTDPIFRVGAIIARKGNILARARNLGRKSHPVQAQMYPDRAHKGLHAEVAVLRGLRSYDVQGYDLFVCRILIDGSYALAKPCDKCQEYLKKFDLRKIYYTVDGGGFEEL